MFISKENLLTIANWLDLTDKMLNEYAVMTEEVVAAKKSGTGDVTLPVGDKSLEYAAIIRRTCSSDEMQQDIRNWAERIDDLLDECPYDCDVCRG